MTTSKPTLQHFITIAIFSIVSLFLTPSHGSSNNVDILVDIKAAEYYVEYSIGTPAVKVSGSLNSGSDLIWLPCNKTPDSNLTKSSTYAQIPCTSDRCTSLPVAKCSPHKTCNYSMTYVDGSSTSGDFSTDSDVTFGAGPPRTLAFGCARDYYNSNPNSISTGRVGLGRGKSSLVQQLGATKFSYCLVPFSPRETTSGKLSLGDEAEVSGGVSTPLVSGSSPSFYYVSMESITIGKQTLRFDGNVIVEIATPMTLVPRALYGSMVDALKASMPADKIINGSDFESDLCYSDVTSFPSVSVRFGGGVSVEWKAENAFAQMGEKAFCIAFWTADDGAEAIYGSYAQANFAMGFDLVANTVSFKPTTC